MQFKFSSHRDHFTTYNCFYSLAYTLTHSLMYICMYIHQLNAGSTQCLKDGAGAVAFTRQGEIPTAEEANYKLVCADGRTQPLNAYQSCNLARVPSHSVVTGGAKPAAYLMAMEADLLKAANSTAFATQFFPGSTANAAGVVFSKDATGLVAAPSASVVSALGEATFAYNALAGEVMYLMCSCMHVHLCFGDCIPVCTLSVYV